MEKVKYAITTYMDNNYPKNTNSKMILTQYIYYINELTNSVHKKLHMYLNKEVKNDIDNYVNNNDFQNINFEVYNEYINNLIIKNKYLYKDIIIQYSIKVYFETVNNFKELLDFSIYLLEVYKYNPVILDEISVEFYNKYKLIHSIELLDLYANIIYNKNEKIIYNFLENIPTEYIYDEDILFYETFIFCTNINTQLGFKNMDEFINKLICSNKEDGIVENIEQNDINYEFKKVKTDEDIDKKLEMKHICNYIVNNFCHDDKFCNVELLIPICKALIITEYLDPDQKNDYIANIYSKIYINDLEDNLGFQKYIETLQEKEDRYKDMLDIILSDVNTLNQKNAAHKLYNEYKNYDKRNVSSNDYIVEFKKNINTYTKVFNSKYKNHDLFTNELKELCREDNNIYLLNVVDSFIFDNVLDGFNTGKIEIKK